MNQAPIAKFELESESAVLPTFVTDRPRCPTDGAGLKRGRRVPSLAHNDHGALLSPEASVDAYIKQPEIGLIYDPFREPDAGADRRLPEYFVVDRSVSEVLWSDQHALVVAGAGAGKSAARAWLAHDCRLRRNGRRLLAVIFNAPSPQDVGGIPPNPARFTVALLRAAVRALLVELLYQPQLLDAVDAEAHRQLRAIEAHRQLRAILEDDLGWGLAYVSEIIADGGLDALISLVDPTAFGLAAQPSAERVQATWKGLVALDPGPGSRPQRPEERWSRFVTFVIGALGYEALYLLVDGLDAYPTLADDPDRAIAMMAPLFGDDQLWADRPVFIKAFLPTGGERSLKLYSSALLTTNPLRATISWTRDDLIRMVRQRLRAASRGALGSFSGISSPELGDAETEIVIELEKAGLMMPRDAIRVAELMLVEHVRRRGAPIYLEYEDLGRALLRHLDVRKPKQAHHRP